MNKRESDKLGWPAMVREVRALRERVGRLERRRRAPHPHPLPGRERGHKEIVARRLAVLGEVTKAGGIVAAGRFREIGRDLGYNPRGLGGFFVGHATLERVGDIVRVTDRGSQILQSRFYEALRAPGQRWRPLLPLKPLFKIEGKSLTQTLLEMREEEYR